MANDNAIVQIHDDAYRLELEKTIALHIVINGYMLISKHELNYNNWKTSSNYSNTSWSYDRLDKTTLHIWKRYS